MRGWSPSQQSYRPAGGVLLSPSLQQRLEWWSLVEDQQPPRLSGWLEASAASPLWGQLGAEASLTSTFSSILQPWGLQQGRVLFKPARRLAAPERFSRGLGGSILGREAMVARTTLRKAQLDCGAGVFIM